MSFYNPNIQAAFDADQHEFIVLRNVVLASYVFVFEICEGCFASTIEDVRAAYQLHFLRIENATQQHNLLLVKTDFALLLAEIAIYALIDKVKSFEDFLNFKLQHTPEHDRNEVLYLGDSIQDYIELLVYSDIATDKPFKGERDFTKLLGVSNSDTDIPVFYNLYDRLKLYARLRNEIKFDIDKDSIIFNEREVRFKFRLSV